MTELPDTTYTIMTIITRPEKLHELKAVLTELGINGMTVTHVEGCGRQNAEITMTENGKKIVMLIPKVQVEVIFPGIVTDSVIDTVCDALRTGIMGDGKIFIQYEKGSVFKIRTGETNEDAI